MDRDQYWFKLWLVASRHQAITWSNADVSSIKPSGIYSVKFHSKLKCWHSRKLTCWQSFCLGLDIITEFIITAPPSPPWEQLRFMGPTWGPPGAARTQVGPMLATRTLLSGHISLIRKLAFTTLMVIWGREQIAYYNVSTTTKLTWKSAKNLKVDRWALSLRIELTYQLSNFSF